MPQLEYRSSPLEAIGAVAFNDARWMYGVGLPFSSAGRTTTAADAPDVWTLLDMFGLTAVRDLARQYLLRTGTAIAEAPTVSACFDEDMHGHYVELEVRLQRSSRGAYRERLQETLRGLRSDLAGIDRSRLVISVTNG